MAKLKNRRKFPDFKYLIILLYIKSISKRPDYSAFGKENSTLKVLKPTPHIVQITVGLEGITAICWLVRISITKSNFLTLKEITYAKALRVFRTHHFVLFK